MLAVGQVTDSKKTLRILHYFSEVFQMINVKRLQKKLADTFGDRVHVELEGDLLRVTGELDTWQDILKACSLCATKKSKVHVVNDIVLKGAEPVPVRTPAVEDTALEGAAPDVLIIGGGITGCAIARELSKYNLDLLLIDKEADFAMQASGRNDGEVHVGVDLSKGSLKQKYVLLGNRMYDKVCRDLDVPFRRIGQYAGFTQSWLLLPVAALVAYRKYHDGVTDAEVVLKKKLLKDNPTFNPDFKFAMYNSLAGIVSPYNLTIAYAENAAQNGAKVSLNTMVKSMEVENGTIKAVHTNRGTVYPKMVVNAAGVFADDIAELAGDRFYSIHPRRGTDTIQDVKSGKIIDAVASVQLINKERFTSHSKGGGIMKTVHGNILAGPDAVEIREKEDWATYPDAISGIYKKQKQTVPAANERDIITYFTGVRAPTFEEDFVIEWGRKCKNMYHAGGIQSPGITAAPAFAIDVAKEIADKMKATEKADWNPVRKGIPEVNKLSPEEREKLILKNPDYGIIICRCEEVSKGEILDALNSPYCPPTIDAIKKRVRPGMGRCQGGFCSPLVTKIIAEHERMALSDVRKTNEQSVMLYGETKEGNKA